MSSTDENEEQLEKNERDKARSDLKRSAERFARKRRATVDRWRQLFEIALAAEAANGRDTAERTAEVAGATATAALRVERRVLRELLKDLLP